MTNAEVIKNLKLFKEYSEKKDPRFNDVATELVNHYLERVSEALNPFVESSEVFIVAVLLTFLKLFENQKKGVTEAAKFMLKHSETVSIFVPDESEDD